MHMNSIVSLIRLIKFYSKVLSKFDIESDSPSVCMTYYFLNERHIFNAKTCLLFIKKFVII